LGRERDDNKEKEKSEKWDYSFFSFSSDIVRGDIISHHPFSQNRYKPVESVMPVLKLILAVASLLAPNALFVISFSTFCCVFNTVLSFLMPLYTPPNWMTNKLRFALNASVLWLNSIGLLVILSNSFTLSTTSTYAGLATPFVCVLILFLPRNWIPACREVCEICQEQANKWKRKEPSNSDNNFVVRLAKQTVNGKRVCSKDLNQDERHKRDLEASNLSGLGYHKCYQDAWDFQRSEPEDTRTPLADTSSTAQSPGSTRNLKTVESPKRLFTQRPASSSVAVSVVPYNAQNEIRQRSSPRGKK
jgi:hypothetical protein